MGNDFSDDYNNFQMKEHNFLPSFSIELLDDSIDNKNQITDLKDEDGNQMVDIWDGVINSSLQGVPIITIEKLNKYF